MAFIPGYDHDIFVSYAHVDDRPFFDNPGGREQPIGWVATLVTHLSNFLAQKFGRSEDFSLWFDTHDLRGDHTVTDEIAARVQRAALFVAILSPGYIASRWCQDEARLFGLSADLEGRIFVVEKALRGEDVAIPPILRGRRGYKFWYHDRTNQPRTLAIPMPHPDDRDYFNQVDDLARDLLARCQSLRDGLSGKTTVAPVEVPSVAPMVAGSAVLLAEVTDDLEFRRDEVQRYLEAHGVLVLPERTYPLGITDFVIALDADLARSRLFVQLLGPLAGKRPPDLPDGYCWLQVECARRRGVPILQWRSPELDLASIEWPRHRELLEFATVQATSLGSFKHAITNFLMAPPPAPGPRRGGAGRPLVFLNTEPRHRAIAAEIRGAIGSRADWTEPLLEGPSKEIREDLEQNLIECDAMVIVYANDARWARAQLHQFRKYSSRRERPVLAIPVIDVPPPEKPDLGMFLDGMVTIDSRTGIGPDTFRRLSESLHL
jgi:hypothetical protein